MRTENLFWECWNNFQEIEKIVLMAKLMSSKRLKTGVENLFFTACCFGNSFDG